MLTGFSDEALWLVWAAAFPLSVFVFSRSKMPLYVLPLFVPAAAGLGRLLMGIYRPCMWFSKAAHLTACAALVIFVVGKAGMPLYPSIRDMSRIHTALTEQCGVRDPSKLAVLGDKSPNGLCYYYDYNLTNVSLDQTAEWADKGGERFLLCGSGWAEVRQRLGSRAFTEHALTKRWHVICVAKAAGAPVDAHRVTR